MPGHIACATETEHRLSAAGVPYQHVKSSKDSAIKDGDSNLYVVPHGCIAAKAFVLNMIQQEVGRNTLVPSIIVCIGAGWRFVKANILGEVCYRTQVGCWPPIIHFEESPSAAVAYIAQWHEKRGR